jgi:hypothetical protein
VSCVEAGVPLGSRFPFDRPQHVAGILAAEVDGERVQDDFGAIPFVIRAPSDRTIEMAAT